MPTTQAGKADHLPPPKFLPDNNLLAHHRRPPRRAFAGLAAQLEEAAAQAGLAEVVEAVVPDLSSRGVKLHDLAGTDEERSFFYEAASTLNRFKQACDEIGWPFGPIFKLLLLTAPLRRRSAQACMH